MNCEKCGQAHERGGRVTCAAHRRGSNPPQPCLMFTGKGVHLCRLHGGLTPQLLAKVAADDIERVLANGVAKYFRENPAPKRWWLPR